MWFLYDPEDGFEEFATEEEAMLAARIKIETYRNHTLREWIDGVERIAVFKKVCGVRDASTCAEHEDWRIDCDCPLTQAEQDAIGL
jgi:hypothetical protein